jgi:hypothetical protein
MMSGMFSELYAWFFPEESAGFRKKAKDAAESRFQAGIHFRSDNEAGLELGRKIAAVVIERIKQDGVTATANQVIQKPAGKLARLNKMQNTTRN